MCKCVQKWQSAAYLVHSLPSSSGCRKQEKAGFSTTGVYVPMWHSVPSLTQAGAGTGRGFEHCRILCLRPLDKRHVQLSPDRAWRPGLDRDLQKPRRVVHCCLPFWPFLPFYCTLPFYSSISIAQFRSTLQLPF